MTKRSLTAHTLHLLLGRLIKEYYIEGRVAREGGQNFSQ
jgi:hypothetical protein